ncbi:MAG: PEP-CTERM sorting domain-containing protein [Proteobacteria bacterium]|nr:PEP-CTERM sorting domain-containing protein [Pseudomonadota bacterium]MBU1736851.1 PEP-CTERM sorting domain-containing protein [Pseudomonadota bacterium]
MKKSIIASLAAFLAVFAVAGQASAYFEQGKLVQVVYAETKNEVLTDLGQYAATGALDLTAQNVQLSAPGSIDYLALTGGASMADLKLGYYMDNSNVTTYDMHAYFVTVNPNAPALTTNYTNLINFRNVADQVSTYAALSGTQTVSHSVAVSGKSYDILFNSNSGDPGVYGGLNLDTGTGEANLAALVDPAGYVDMYLYHTTLNLTNGAVELVPGATTDYVAVLRLNADGSTTLNPNAVPLPASMLLFGSSFIGLLGFRRRKRA